MFDWVLVTPLNDSLTLPFLIKTARLHRKVWKLQLLHATVATLTQTLKDNVELLFYTIEATVLIWNYQPQAEFKGVSRTLSNIFDETLCGKEINN